MRDSLYTAGKDKTPTVNPLIRNGQKLIPSVTRVFSRRSDLHVYLQAYERGATTMQPLVAFVTFYRGQTKAFETPPLPVTEGMDPKSKAVPLGFSLALNKLQPGRYTCQVTVVDTTGQKAAFGPAAVLLVPAGRGGHGTGSPSCARMHKAEPYATNSLGYSGESFGERCGGRGLSGICRAWSGRQ
jgi:hypothetical protein